MSDFAPDGTSSRTAETRVQVPIRLSGAIAALWSAGSAIRFPSANPELSKAMRAEIQAIVDDIKQSVGLLRRHL